MRSYLQNCKLAISIILRLTGCVFLSASLSHFAVIGCWGHDVMWIKNDKTVGLKLKRGVQLHLYLTGIRRRYCNDRIKRKASSKENKKSPRQRKRKILHRYMDKVLLCFVFCFRLL